MLKRDKKVRYPGALCPPKTVEEFRWAFDNLTVRDLMSNAWARQWKRRWAGIKTLKNPFDCWVYQELIAETRPDIVIEIGSAWGGSTLFFCAVLDSIGHGELISIEICPEISRIHKKNISHPRLNMVWGRSTDVVERVQQLCAGRRGFVIHDADHKAESVLQDVRIYSNFVAIGSYLVIEDTLNEIFARDQIYGWNVKKRGPGPFVAAQQFVKEDDRFVVDNSCHQLIYTVAPFGFLKRIKE